MYTLIFIFIKIAPAFVNQYYHECISQNLATVCYPVQWPTILEIAFYLFG